MWGAGSSVGHRMVDGVMGPRTMHYEANDANEGNTAQRSSPSAANACAGPMELFSKCLEQNTNDVAQCQAFADLLTSCKRDQMQ
jgi:hypothetical protein